MGRVKAKGKWMDGLDADTPTADAARAYLSVRLGSVVQLLPLAHESYADDPEYVHQVRVATRRSDAALLAFRACLKPPRFEKMRWRLRKIRRAAGMARICDVHEMLFTEGRESAEGAHRAAYDHALGCNRAARTEAQRSIDKVAARYADGKLEQAVAKLLDRLRPPKKKKNCAVLIDAARDELPDLIQHVRHIASLDMGVLHNMHDLRIAGKQLRYAMEIFAPCYEPAFRNDLYPMVEEMQERLGAVNDAREIVDRIRRWAKPLRSTGDDGARMRRALIDVALCYRRQCRDHGDAFLRWWSSIGAGRFLDDLEHVAVGGT